MFRVNVKKINVMDVLVTIFLVELVLGGAGKVIMFGPISIRYVIMMVMLAVQVVLMVKNKILVDFKNITLFIMEIVFLINCLVSYTYNVNNAAISTYLGMFPIILCLFFQVYFKEKADRAKAVVELFKKLTIILSVFSIVLWSYCLVRGVAVYDGIEVGFMRRYSYGMLTYIGNVPRVFFKGSVFVCIGSFIWLSEVLRNPKNIKLLIIFLLHFVSVIVSFTVGFIVFSIIGYVYVIIRVSNSKKILKRIIVGALLCAIVLVGAYELGAYDVIIERFSGSYKMSMKFVQAGKLFEGFMESPLYGKGMGCQFEIDYGTHVEYHTGFEVMWGQILMNLGLIGFLPFVAHIVTTIGSLRRRFSKAHMDFFFFFEIGVLFLCLVSFVNPFMNNYLGTTFYAMASGLSVSKIEDDNDITKVVVE